MEALIGNTGGVQVAAGLPVFPAEVAALSDVGSARSTVGFIGAKQVSKVAEMLLRAYPFGGGIVFQWAMKAAGSMTRVLAGEKPSAAIGADLENACCGRRAKMGKFHRLPGRWFGGLID